ncbi:uncharacterized protein MONBRDRAFT_24567 [Monosiga brevicollis MX1]|uniref:Peptidase M12B domain-containing protein n=1 Tax=Monosiga brevicollis TaxID=81824 RepID=A9UWU2_MONBE|nr:uncharacterized protein MONBRDRAFT_24567 [Monosiga brevicollis MX1]EDQ90276.1 predicted protein [Monosiga brevicollis MX1]|eukprot:XP_001745043.1 hypothetical protein [Monosiga brevicollis MX1]
MHRPAGTVQKSSKARTNRRTKPNNEPRLEVVLIEGVHGLGGAGARVQVRRGYGRNFLIPQGKAAYATPANLKQYFNPAAATKAMSQRSDLTQQKIVKHLETKHLVFRKAQSKPFQITPQDISQALETQMWMQVPVERIEMENLAAFGPHHVTVVPESLSCVCVCVCARAPRPRVDSSEAAHTSHNINACDIVDFFFFLLSLNLSLSNQIISLQFISLSLSHTHTRMHFACHAFVPDNDLSLSQVDACTPCLTTSDAAAVAGQGMPVICLSCGVEHNLTALLREHSAILAPNFILERVTANHRRIQHPRPAVTHFHGVFQACLDASRSALGSQQPEVSSIWLALGLYPQNAHLPRFSSSRRSHGSTLPLHSDVNSHRRRAGLSAAQNTCIMRLLVDSRYYTQAGEDMAAVASDVIAVVAYADANMRRQQFKEYSNIGLAVGGLVIFDDPSTDPFYKPETWDVSFLLQIVSTYDHSDVCLAHLFTHQDFDDGVQGLAFVGSSGGTGICAGYQSQPDRWLNVGLTSSLNWGQPVLRATMMLTFQHEVGHNFGSSHDPETNECMPTKLSVVPVPVQRNAGSRAATAFNLFLGLFAVTAFWSLMDQLTSGATCSDMNNGCCNSCQVAASSFKCFDALNLDIYCRNDSYCNGISPDCPEAPQVKTPCLQPPVTDRLDAEQVYAERTHSGTGTTASKCFPEVLNQAPFTDGGADFSVEALRRYPGSPCDQGTCSDEGQCVDSSDDSGDSFTNLVESISLADFQRWVEEYTVIFTFVIVFVVWFPVAYCLARRDARELAELQAKSQYIANQLELRRRRNTIAWKPDVEAQPWQRNQVTPVPSTQDVRDVDAYTQSSYDGPSLTVPTHGQSYYPLDEDLDAPIPTNMAPPTVLPGRMRYSDASLATGHQQGGPVYSETYV